MSCRCFKSSGAIVLLFWEVSAALMVFHFYRLSTYSYLASFSVLFGVGILSFPIFGLLGDAVLGRYRTIKFSIIIMWSSVLLNGIGEVFYYAYGYNTDKIWKTLSDYIQLCGVITCGCLLVNSLQFGVDQLMDAPSRQITSFISWFTWCFYLSDILSVLILDCGCIGAFSTVFIAVIVTVALCVDILYNKDLVKEPTSRNPLKLIFKVLKYAATNKYPHARSAFSYWDQKKSRINLSKSKYGGPFTHEEVEDVKTFFRMLWILLIGSFFVGYFIVYADTLKFEIGRFQNDGLAGMNRKELSVSCLECLELRSLLNSTCIIIIIGVPLLEFLFFPFLKKCSIFHLSTTTRFNFGILFFLFNQINNLILDVVGSVTANRHNVTQLCLLDSSKETLSEGSTFTMSYYWLYMPIPFSSVAYYLLLTSAMEFMCAQSPYSMKGLLMGMMYSFIGLFTVVNIGLRRLYWLFPWQGSCTTLYYGISTMFTAFSVVLFFFMSKWYSRRRRRDNEDKDMPVGSYVDYYLYQQSGSVASS